MSGLRVMIIGSVIVSLVAATVLLIFAVVFFSRSDWVPGLLLTVSGLVLAGGSIGIVRGFRPLISGSTKDLREEP